MANRKSLFMSSVVPTECMTVKPLTDLAFTTEVGDGFPH